MVNTDCFLPKKCRKNIFFVAFSFVGKHKHTKFQKISPNVLDFASFLHLSILAIFLLNNGQKKAEVQKKFFCSIFILIGSIYIPNFIKFHQVVWILQIFLIFGQLWLFFGPKKAKKCRNRKTVFLWPFFLTYQISENFIKQFGVCQFS